MSPSHLDMSANCHVCTLTAAADRTRVASSHGDVEVCIDAHIADEAEGPVLPCFLSQQILFVLTERAELVSLVHQTILFSVPLAAAWNRRAS